MEWNSEVMKLPQLCEIMMTALIVLAFVATLVCAACKIAQSETMPQQTGDVPFITAVLDSHWDPLVKVTWQRQW